jgi:hypothetical protein
VAKHFRFGAVHATILDRELFARHDAKQFSNLAKHSWMARPRIVCTDL